MAARDCPAAPHAARLAADELCARQGLHIDAAAQAAPAPKTAPTPDESMRSKFLATAAAENWASIMEDHITAQMKRVN